MCAFAILAGITGMVTAIFVQNMEKGSTAVSRRELREAADTVFRKILYQWHEYEDGDSRTLDEEYAEFARLRGWQRDRWAVYRYELEKEREVVAGVDLTGEHESLFEDNQNNEEESGFSDEQETDEAQDGVTLLRLTMHIYKTDEPGGEPLVSLTTWLDAPEETDDG